MCSKEDSPDKRGVFLSTRQGQNVVMSLDSFLRLLRHFFILYHLSIANSHCIISFLLMGPDLRADQGCLMSLLHHLIKPPQCSWRTILSGRFRLPQFILGTSSLMKTRLWTASHKLYVFILITQLAPFSSKVNCLLYSGRLIQVERDARKKERRYLSLPFAHYFKCSNKTLLRPESRDHQR